MPDEAVCPATAVLTKASGRAAEILSPEAFTLGGYQLHRYLEVLVTQMRYFQMTLLIIWKYWSHRGATSKCHSLLFGSIGHSDALLPNIKLHCLEVWSAQRLFFQIITSRVWKYEVPNCHSSKWRVVARMRGCGWRRKAL